MTLLTLYAGEGGEPAVPIPAGAILGSGLVCNDDPSVAVYSSLLACSDDPRMSLSSGLVCDDDPDVLTLGSAQACDGPPAFFKPVPVATRSSGRFFLI